MVSDSLVIVLKCKECSSPEDSYQNKRCVGGDWQLRENVPQVKELASISDAATKLCEHQRVIQSQIILTIKWGYGEDPGGNCRFKLLLHTSQLWHHRIVLLMIPVPFDGIWHQNKAP